MFEDLESKWKFLPMIFTKILPFSKNENKVMFCNTFAIQNCFRYLIKKKNGKFLP